MQSKNSADASVRGEGTQLHLVCDSALKMIGCYRLKCRCEPF